MRRLLRRYVFVVVLLAELPLLVPAPFPLTDHLVFWEAGRMVATGSSPYDMAVWTDVARTYQSGHLAPFVDVGRPVWIYPAWTVALFVPFGLLPYPAGPLALYIAYLVVGLFAAMLFVRSLPAARRPPTGIAVAIVAAFQPLLIADRYGQFGAFLLLGLVLVYRGLKDRSMLPLVTGSLILFTKPQLFLIVAVYVLAVLVRRRDVRAVGAVVASLAVVAILTTVRYPESLAFFRAGVSERVGVYFGVYSSTWAFAEVIVGPWWPILGASLVVATVVACAVGVRSLPADLRAAGSLAAAAVISLAITPVDFHYDQVPLILALILGVAVGRRPYQVALTWGLGVVVPWCLFFLDLGLAGEAQLSGIVPLLVATLFAASAYGGGSSTGSPAINPSSPLIANTAVKLK